LLASLQRAAAAFADPQRWPKLQKNGMAADFSWAAPAQSYAALYARL
jgi:starch synthase